MLYEKVLAMGGCEFYRYKRAPHEQWLELRKTGIGGSDAGAIMGLSKYSTPLSAYLAKKGFAGFNGNKATEWGNILEGPVRQKAREELGIGIEAVPGMFTSKSNPFMNANIDGLVFIEGEKEISGSVASGLGGHEIKTSRSGEGFTSDEVPDSYYAQVQHYMAVTGLPFFILTVFIFDRYEGRHYVIPRNDDFIALLIEREKEFWENNVLAGVAPAPTGNENEMDLIKSLPMPEEICLDGGCEALLDEKELLDGQIKELQSKSDVIKEQILLRISQAGGGGYPERATAICGNWKITLNTQTRKVVDSSALKKAGIYDEYTKESCCKVMRITKAK